MDGLQGPIGWLDISGSGEFRVALRSGLVNREGTTLFAGAGVVAGSDPERELIETDMKLKAMLDHIMAQVETKQMNESVSETSYNWCRSLFINLLQTELVMLPSHPALGQLPFQLRLTQLKV